MAPHTRNQANHTDNENTIRNEDGIAENANVNPTQNPEALTLLATQLVVLLAKGANTKQGGKQDGGERRGCSLEQFNKQHPLTFEGLSDAVAAENWILQMEKLMEVM
ncbi:hypothetical protein SLA2020_380690 [Shorea laevis]